MVNQDKLFSKLLLIYCIFNMYSYYIYMCMFQIKHMAECAEGLYLRIIVNQLCSSCEMSICFYIESYYMKFRDTPICQLNIVISQYAQGWLAVAYRQMPVADDIRGIQQRLLWLIK